MPTQLTRTQKRQNETRERIFRADMQLFAEKGFENTTVAEITEAADIGKGTFFTYFPTKEAIFRQPGQLALEAIASAAQAGLAQGQPVAQVLKGALTASAAWHEANKSLTGQMVKSNFSFSLDDASSKGKLLELLVRLVAAGQQAGEFKQDIHAQDAALVLAGVYFSVIAYWATREDRPLAGRMAAALDVILKGLAA